MPCQSFTDSEIRQMAENRHRDEISKLAKEINELTRLLCYACKQINIEHQRVMSGSPMQELKNWYSEHKKHDTKRLQKVFNKLDEEDRDALRAAILSGDVK